MYEERIYESSSERPEMHQFARHKARNSDGVAEIFARG